MGHESFQVQKPPVDTKSLFPCRVTRRRAAMMRQALLVRLRWSLLFSPSVSLGERGRRRCISANHGWLVPGSTGCGKQGSPAPALDGSAQCFTTCTSLRAARLDFGFVSPDLYTLFTRSPLSIVRNNHSLSQLFAPTLFSEAISVYRVHSFLRTAEKTVQYTTTSTISSHTQ